MQVEIGQRIVLLKDIRLRSGTLMAYHCVFNMIPVEDAFHFQMWRRVVRTDGKEEYRLISQTELTHATSNHSVSCACVSYDVISDGFL